MTILENYFDISGIMARRWYQNVGYAITYFEA